MVKQRFSALVFNIRIFMFFISFIPLMRSIKGVSRYGFGSINRVPLHPQKLL
ncbi:MAG: hypothetical protein RL491_232 [Bacteroidota bacterium]|jgi:hypothetical protein